MRFADEVHSTLKSHLKYIGFAVLTGICVYFSLMSNNLVNNLDGIWHSSNFIAGNWEISLGRGLQRYADRARFGLVTSAWNSIIVFILIGTADSLIIARFRLRDTLFSYLLVFATISNPIVCESLSYCYMSVNFGLAYFFSVLSVPLRIRTVGSYLIPDICRPHPACRNKKEDPFHMFIILFGIWDFHGVLSGLYLCLCSIMYLPHISDT